MYLNHVCITYDKFIKTLLPKWMNQWKTQRAKIQRFQIPSIILCPCFQVPLPVGMFNLWFATTKRCWLIVYIMRCEWQSLSVTVEELLRCTEDSDNLLRYVNGHFDSLPPKGAFKPYCPSPFICCTNKEILFSNVTPHRHFFNFITALCSAARQISFEPILINNSLYLLFDFQANLKVRLQCRSPDLLHISSVLKGSLWWI